MRWITGFLLVLALSFTWGGYNWGLANPDAISQVTASCSAINTASKSAFDAVRGIGPVKAQAIIDYRNKNGAFANCKALENVSGIGPTLAKRICVHFGCTY